MVYEEVVNKLQYGFYLNISINWFKPVGHFSVGETNKTHSRPGGKVNLRSVQHYELIF